MDSDDEFDNPMPAGAKLVDGLNLKELLATGHTDFEIDDKLYRDYDDLDDLVGLTPDEKRKMNEKAEDEDLEKAFYKQFEGNNKTFRGVDEFGNVLQDEDTSYEAIAKRMDNITADGGIKKLIVQPGYGNKVKIGSNVSIHYTVCAEDLEDPIDDSRDHDFGRRKGDPFRFKVGGGNVIPIIEIGVETMMHREKSKFLAHYKYAYGKLGNPPRIPEEATVMVTIEVVDVEEGSTQFNMLDMDRQERLEIPFDELLKGVQELKKAGNKFYEEKEYTKAKREYKNAMELSQDLISPHENQNAQKLELSYSLYINIAQCEICESRFKKAIQYCKTAINLPLPIQKKRKAYYRLALSLNEVGQVQEAKEQIATALGMDAANPEIQALYRKILAKLEKDKQDEKDYAAKMFQKHCKILD